MNGLIPGIWEIADQGFQWLGRGVAWLLFRRRPTSDESTLCAAAGSALVWAAFGGVIGFFISGPSRDVGAIGGMILGGLIGACLGICFGVFVETIDTEIKGALRSLDSK